jgi:membrane complex biogenesis BtpA family protein
MECEISMLKETFGSEKPIVGMIHLLPLPGSPLYDSDGGIRKIVDHAAKDIAALERGGVDAVMFGNEGDRPYLLKATPVALASYGAVVGELRGTLRKPFGVNYLWDPVASVALAVALGANFAREIFTGVYESDMGLWAPDAASALRLRSDAGRSDLKLMFNINAEFASPVGSRTIAQRAKSVVFSSLADIVLVSGPMTGEAVETTNLTQVKNAIGAIPVFANTGVNIDNVEKILSIADGAIVGTHFKVGGDTWKAVDPERVKRFMDRVRKLR